MATNLRVFEYSSKFDCSSEELFTWHKAPRAFERLCPYWESVKVLEHEGNIKNGAGAKLILDQGLIKLHWHLIHEDYQEGQQFCDRQISGPFAYWRHIHLVQKNGASNSLLIDRIEYELPLGWLGNLLGHQFTQNKLLRLFKFRHQVTKNDIEQYKNLKGNKKMKILISGSSGLVGKELNALLENQGHDVFSLVRSEKLAKKEKNIFWDPELGILDELNLVGFDAVIHLAGENIASKRWSKKQKEKIKSSRIKSTKLLSDSLAKLKNPPKVFICASAIGFYGDRPNELVLEHSPSQKGDFLSETCVAWETACNSARSAGIRVVHTRFGIILSPKGGALAKLLLPFQMGAGGIIGNGKQVMSWISLDDVIYALVYVLQNEDISGPVNFTAPRPVTNHEFTKTLGKVLRRPTLFPVPSFAAKIVFGEMADALLLSSLNAKPKVLEESGFKFTYPDLESALRHLLGH